MAAGLHRDPEPGLTLAIRHWLHRVDAVADDVLALLGCDTAWDRPLAPQMRENDRRRAIVDGLGIIVTDQGTEVHILSEQSSERLADVERLLSAQRSPTAIVAQQYVPLSRLSSVQGAYCIEIRPVTYVLGWQDVQVGRQPLGKAVSAHETRQLTNISQGAHYLPVLTARS